VRRFMEEFDAEEVAGGWESLEGGTRQDGDLDMHAVRTNEKGT
jgi:hypothetical protein